MCKAFSCIISKRGKVTWKLAVDSHDELIKLAGYEDDTADKRLLKFARVEITPIDGNYLNKDAKWGLKIDEKIRPEWWTEDHEKKCYLSWQKWKKQLDKIIVYKPIIHPFRDITPPDKIDPVFLKDLIDWASVRASVWASVWASVGASVGASVRDSMYAYVGSFFLIKKSEWKYCDNVTWEGYPFQPAVDLWCKGIIPSYDGKVWRLHVGPDARVLWQGTIEDARKQLNELSQGGMSN